MYSLYYDSLVKWSNIAIATINVGKRHTLYYSVVTKD